MSKRAVLSLAALAVAACALAIGAGAFAAGGPTATTGSASTVTDTGAALSASVNPNGQATSYAFEYGTSTAYTVQTAVQDAGSGTQPVTVGTQLSGLRPGTTYHFRVIATSASGTTTGNDATFTTSGIAPPAPAGPLAATGPAAAPVVDGGTLTGTVNSSTSPPGETETYYFQLGTALPYVMQTVPATLKAGAAPTPVTAKVSGLESLHAYHYRLVAVSETGHVSVGADQTFSTLPRERLRPAAVQISASPASQRAIPDRVTVSGRMVPPHR